MQLVLLHYLRAALLALLRYLCNCAKALLVFSAVFALVVLLELLALLALHDSAILD